MKQQGLSWYQDAKYGVFIHWGLYSILGGEWKGRPVEDVTEWIMKNGKIPLNEYKELVSQFSPIHFDADAWMKHISDYGAKYVCITAKHHDGFAMYESKVCDYNVMHSPFGRDVVGELAVACRKHGMKFCVYYSQMQDWADPDGFGNTWDYHPIEQDFKRYFYGKVLPQVTELLTNYGEIGMIWFDTPYEMPIELCRELRDTVKKLQPDCLINGRIGYGLGDYRQMSDNCIPARPYDGLWETPMTLNDTWGYSHTDHHWKTAADVLLKLTEITSRGGNLLLNIGPDAMGNIPQESDRILAEVGAWLRRNGESIFGTRATIEMPYVIPWGVCTMKGQHLYLHVMKYPADVKQIRLFNLKLQVERVSLLDGGEALRYVQTYETARNEDRFRIFVPNQPKQAVDTVIDVEYKGRIHVVPLEELNTMFL